MIRISTEALHKYLIFNKFIFYFLIGQDYFLIQQSIKLIIKKAENHGYLGYFTFIIEYRDDPNWYKIFNLINSKNFFHEKLVISIIIINDKQVYEIEQKFSKLTSLNFKDVIFIIQFYLKKIQEKIFISQKIFNKSILVNCNVLNRQKLNIWIKNKACEMKLSIDQNIIEILCDYYEGNMIALYQVLKILSTKNYEKINYKIIKSIIKDCSFFSFKSFINILLDDNLKKTVHILHKFKNQLNNPMFFISTIKNNIIYLINNKKCNFRNYRNTTIKGNFYNTFHKLNLIQLKNIIALIIKMEGEIHKQDPEILWMYIDHLIIMIHGVNYL